MKCAPPLLIGGMLLPWLQQLEIFAVLLRIEGSQTDTATCSRWGFMHNQHKQRVCTPGVSFWPRCCCCWWWCLDLPWSRCFSVEHHRTQVPWIQWSPARIKVGDVKWITITCPCDLLVSFYFICYLCHCCSGKKPHPARQHTYKPVCTLTFLTPNTYFLCLWVFFFTSFRTNYCDTCSTWNWEPTHVLRSLFRLQHFKTFLKGIRQQPISISECVHLKKQ